jgi:phosphosulfolactate phosphohydrolase-like enzyme
MKLFTVTTSVEDIALAKAIAKGINGENVSREEVFALLSE